VESVTRIPGETYTELIERAATHPRGRYVKLVDNSWNITLNPELAQVDPAKAESMLTGRYLPARRRLLDACDLDEYAPAVLEMQQVLDEHRDRLLHA